MESKQLSHLLERNQRIIRAVIQKTERDCPSSIALIGIAGSFCSGDFYEKSDLDLLIVANDEKANCVSSCFILEDVAHDIYCTSWAHLEEMAEYRTPHVAKLIDINWVYILGEASQARYNALREKLFQRLSSPLSPEDIHNAEIHLQKAEAAYGRLMVHTASGACRMDTAEMLYQLEFVLYLMNHACIRHGIHEIPAEIAGMARLPEHFLTHYHALIRAETQETLRSAATSLLQCVVAWLEEIQQSVLTPLKKQPTEADLIGSYEEIYSNWRNKMYRSINQNDPYLSFMTAASCQNFYNSMYQNFDINRIDLLQSFSPVYLKENARAFDEAMEDYLNLYRTLHLPVRQYASLEEFETAYLQP